MYIVRWLKGHPIISIWLLGLIAIVLSWSSNMTKKSSADIDHSNPPSISTDSDQKSKKPELGLAGKGEESSSKSSSLQTIDKNVGDSTAKTTNNIQPVKPKVSDSAIKNNPSVDSVVVDTNKQPANVAEQNSSGLNKTSTEELLLIAREAYWNNGLDEAADIYRQLIKLEPDVLDHKGELGNVYWRQGFPKKAAELYSEIAIPMINSGKAEPVANMLGFIGLFYPDRAALINDHLHAEKSK